MILNDLRPRPPRQLFADAPDVQRAKEKRLDWALTCVQPNLFQAKRLYKTVVRDNDRSFVSLKNKTTTTADTSAMPIR
jgi:hypothetical protein